MNRIAISLSGLAAVFYLFSASFAGEPIKVTVIVRGAHCEQCVNAVRESLAKVKGLPKKSCAFR